MESMNTEGWLSLIEKSKSQLESNLSLDHWPCSLWRGQHSSGLPWAWGIQGSPLGSVYTQNHDTAPPLPADAYVCKRTEISVCFPGRGWPWESSPSLTAACGPQATATPEFTGLRFLILVSVLGSKEVGKLERGAGHSVWLKSEAQNSAAFHSIPTSGTSEQWKACLCRIRVAYKFLYDLQDPHWTLHLLCFMCLLSHSTNIC